MPTARTPAFTVRLTAKAYAARITEWLSRAASRPSGNVGSNMRRLARREDRRGLPPERRIRDQF